MNAKITINSGRSTRGQNMGCTRDQCYSSILDVSARDKANCYLELYVSSPCDDADITRVAAQQWAETNGVDVTGNFQPTLNTGADADIQANR